MKEESKLAKRMLFDSSVYGQLVIQPELAKIISEIAETNKILFYGNELIRRELKNTPKDKRFENRQLRILLLNLYDSLIKEHNLRVTDIVEDVADEYFLQFQKEEGGLGYKEVITDFCIVASASLHKLDIVVSHDTTSMLSKAAVKAYEKVNQKYQLTNPKFIPFNEFKNKIKSYERTKAYWRLL